MENSKKEVTQTEYDRELEKFLDGRPEIIKELARKVPPGKLYRFRGGNRVFPYCYNEDGTLDVIVSGDYNFCTFERRVFGVKPEDLVECEFPDEGELLGAVLTESEDIDNFLGNEKKNGPSILDIVNAFISKTNKVV